MSERPRASDDRQRGTERADSAGVSPGEEGRTGLRLTVVEYEDRPDRGTIHPDDLTGVERMATWLSADRSAFVDLETRR